jgi:hypothetical protein
MPLEPTRLDNAPPTLLFVPPGDHASLPLVLLGHGAHLSKDDPIMQVLAKGFCRNVPAAVALMDCPGHGERRAADIATEEQFNADVAARMSSASNLVQVRDDWIAVERAARAADPRITGPTGYAGFSMGAIFGMCVVGELPSVTTAVFALGGLTSDDARNMLIREGVRRLGDREVMMLNMTHDEHFAMDGALEVFAAIPGPKRMGVWEGTHVDIKPEAIEWAITLFQRTLVPAPTLAGRP